MILKKLIQEKKDEHIPSGYSLFTQCSFDEKNKIKKKKKDWFLLR